MITKEMYDIEKAQYQSWVSIIKFLTFGKVDLTEQMNEILSEFVVVNL